MKGADFVKESLDYQHVIESLKLIINKQSGLLQTS